MLIEIMQLGQVKRIMR